MPGSIVRNVLISIILVVVCVVIGVESAENRTSAMGILIALVVGSFMLWIGPRCWVLIFLVPPAMELLPLPGKIGALPISFLVGTGVLAYWFVMWGMGYVKFKWRGLLALDAVVLCIFLYMIYSYIQHPVSMAIFGYDAEYVGGKEYGWCLVATLFYLAVSCIPFTHEQFDNVARWVVRLTLGMCILSILLQLAGVRGGVDVTELAEAATTTRFGMFVKLGLYGIYILYGMNPMSRVIASPFLFMGCLISFCGILISGWREILMSHTFIITTLAFIKRELWCLTLLGLLVYGGLVYLSSEGIVEKFPVGMQRCLSVAPGIKISREVEEGAKHSSEWRVEMWKWALDPRTKYIHDYVWGDGFGQSVSYLRRETIAMMRQTAVYGDQDFFANTGTWHNGAITTVHRLGIVGLVMVTAMYILAFCLMVRVCQALRGTPLFLPAMFMTLSYAGAPSLFYISEGTIVKFFNSYVVIAMIKLFYCIAREKGLIIPWMLRQRYVPLVIQEHENRIRPVEN